ncbi:MAG: hypothetical protein IIA08_08565, partial [Proteobacteria bacterium]|nr:hypothetical protein [Pseudomonadota bacterium]
MASTLWMFADDHRREWKHYQSTFRDVEYTMTVWSQLQEETSEKSAEHKRLMTLLQDEQAKKPDSSAIGAFNAE